MGTLTPTKIILSDINSGQEYVDGDVVTADTINAPLEASAYAQDVAERANTKASQALDQVQSVLGSYGFVVTPLDVYPVGSIYLTLEANEPAKLFGGTWVKLENCFLYASGDLSSSANGGSKTITQGNLPSGVTGWVGINARGGNSCLVSGGATGVFAPTNTSQSGNGGYATGVYSPQEDGYFGVNFDLGGKGEDYMPPYLVVNMWQRVA